MTLPGVEIITQDARDQAGADNPLATIFAVAETTWGPEAPVRVRGAFEQTSKLGERTVDTIAVHDDLALHFLEGGAPAYVRRLLGPAAAAATTSLAASSSVALVGTAIYKGARGNRYSVDVDVSGGTFVLTVFFDGKLQLTSPALTDGPSAAAWSAQQVALGLTEFLITDGPAPGNPVATASPQAALGGNDDFAGITNTQIQTATASLVSALGPGTLVYPGRTALPTQTIGAAHVNTPGINRLLRVELPATRDVTTLKAQAAQIRPLDLDGRIDILAPRLPFAGLTPTTTRTGSPCMLRTGAEARNDAAGISPNQPAAGRWGIAQAAGTPTIEWTDDEREQLNDAGINVVRVIDGDVRLYGSRTAVDPQTQGVALRIGSARLRMALVELARGEAENEEFGEIDAGGVALGNLRGAIRAAVKQFTPSLYYFDVQATLESGDLPGEYFVQVTIVFQAAPDAERVRVVITRELTEI